MSCAAHVTSRACSRAPATNAIIKTSAAAKFQNSCRAHHPVMTHRPARLLLLEQGSPPSVDSPRASRRRWKRDREIVHRPCRGRRDFKPKPT
jgi:hypothetical protein